MPLSQLATSIAASPTLQLNEAARLLKERGESVINLGIGEPRNKAPINALLSSAARLTSGDVKYTPTDGLPSLKKAIIRSRRVVSSPRWPRSRPPYPRPPRPSSSTAPTIRRA